ncbi:hypothetical protein [Pandoraea sputorum]|uniref:EscI/YscI/HrpB family type III secretion system inner rod protein n=1 Tax=Pandoraea sputorum TaxID=93222 RepID=A0A5E5BN06_9BURK|nr:hypothetical protein [Pandoraea sputorum]VVE85680.1 hypothetical protein PSP31121_05355 [Pandoraea sputorum]
MNIDTVLRSLGGAATTGQPAEPTVSLQQRFASLLNTPLDASSAADPAATAVASLASPVAAPAPLGAAGLLKLQLELHANAISSDVISKGVNFGVQGINKLVNQS